MHRVVVVDRRDADCSRGPRKIGTLRIAFPLRRPAHRFREQSMPSMPIRRRVLPAMALPLVVASCALAGCGEAEPLGETHSPRGIDEPPAVMDIRAEGFLEAEARVVVGPPYPIILVHGFSGWGAVGPVEYFFGIKDMLEAEGSDVTTPVLPPYNSSEERARVLAAVIDEVLARTSAAKVHLIGHSQGGLDIRRVVSHSGLDYASRVASVITISTPHDGSEVADRAVQAPAGVLNPAGQFLAWLLGAAEGDPPTEADWASDATSDAWTPDLQLALESLRPGSVRALVARNPMPPEVPFFTVAGVSNLRSLDTAWCAASVWGTPERVDDIDPIFLPTGTFLSSTAGGSLLEPTPNDGLVTVESARAPEGTFLGCVPADHADEIGQVADLIPGLVSGWDHHVFYRRLVEQLRAVE